MNNYGIIYINRISIQVLVDVMIEKLFTIGIRNTEQPFHWYDTLELFFVVRGEVDLISNNNTVHMSRGHIQVVNTEDVHALENKTEDLLYIQLSMSMEAFDQYIPDISIVYFKCDSEEDAISEEIKNYIAQMVRMLFEYKENEYLKSETEQTLIYYCVEILSDMKMRFNYGRYEMENASEKELEKIDQIRKVVDYLFDNGKNKITLKDTADHIFVGTSTFKKLMKEYGGGSFEKLLSSIRAEMSLKYLLDSNMSITNIAYECGFSAPRYYYSAFEKKYQCSPVEYRERNRKYFIKEKKSNAMCFTCDEEIKISDIIELLRPYSEFKADSELNRNIINIDISAKRSHKSKFPKVDNVLICEEDDVYRLDFTEELALCRKTLGIRKLRIIGSNSRLCANIEKNVSYLGITVSDIWQKKEESERNVLLSELFGRHGEKKPLYYIYELFNRIEQPFTRLNPNCILHDKGGNLNITAFNIDNGDEKLLYKFDISGLEDGDDYVCIKTEAPKLTEAVKNLIADETKKLDREIVKELAKPSIEYNVYKKGIPFIIDVAVENNSFVNIEIIRIR